MACDMHEAACEIRGAVERVADQLQMANELQHAELRLLEGIGARLSELRVQHELLVDYMGRLEAAPRGEW